MSKQPKPAKRRESAGERIAKLIDPEGTITSELWRRRIGGKIDRAIRTAVKEAAHCEREFVYDALSDMGHHALCKQLRERINKHTRKYGANP